MYFFLDYYTFKGIRATLTTNTAKLAELNCLILAALCFTKLYHFFEKNYKCILDEHKFSNN